MSYQVLARKYRPQTFEQVVGQKPIVTTLQNAVERNRVHHAYLFSGLRGVGKTTVARLMAKALNCEKGPTPKPCNACASCEEITAGRSLDVLEIDGASNRGIDAVRELRETVRYAPARDRYKVYIIDEVHMLTSEAWNALLKTLEEPPANVSFLFATTDYRKLPLTILSRCQHFEFKKIPRAEMRAHLELVARGEGVTVPSATLDLIGRVAGGSLRDAQSALDQVIAFSGDQITADQARTILGVVDHELVSGFFDAVRAGDCDRLVQIIDEVFEKGYQAVPFLEDLMAHGRDLLLARALKKPQPYLEGNPEEIAALIERSAAFTDDALLRLLELITREELRLKNTAHPRFLMEALAIKLARLADLQPIEELIARLDRPAGDPGGPPSGPTRGRTGALPPARGQSPSGTAPTSTASSAAPPAVRSAAAADDDTSATAATANTAPSPPDESAPGAANAASGVAIVEAFLKQVHEERGAIGGFLGQAQWVEVVGDVLEIAYGEKQSFFRDRVADLETTEYLRGVAAGAAGRPLQIKVVVASAATIDRPVAASPADDERARKARLRDEALREPMVKTLLDTFGGEVIDVDQV